MRIFILFFLTYSVCLFNTCEVKAQEQNKRYVLLEEFSNTYCPPCIFRHPTFNENILTQYEDIEVYHISYHVGSPIPDDIFYQANIEEVEERANYYQIFGTPSLYVLGNFSPSGAAPDYEILPAPRLEDNLGSISPINIEVNESLTSLGERKVDIEIHSIHQMIPNPNFKLKVVVVEKVIEYEPPFEGMETTLHNIFRKTLGTWQGVSFNPAAVGESISYEYTYP
ncbi:MAG: TlpA family protein disulfide reductase, partial [Chitinophagales bacterium]